MSRRKFYAVKVGRITGVFDSWSECEEQIKGFPNALYKAFGTKELAIEYLENQPNQLENDSNTSDIQLYTDGSFNEKKHQYGWAYVAVKDNKIQYKKNGAGTNSKYLGSRQVGGEIVAVLQGLDYAIYKEYKHVEICYDYSGIENWANDSWDTRTQIAKAYRYWLDKKRAEIEISFKKIEAHSGNRFNGIADKLAKEGANM